MKYSEFEKLMKDNGFEVDVSKNRTIVYNREGNICGWVSNREPETLDMTWKYYHDLPKKLRRFVGQKCFELAFTELEDREEKEVLYYLRQIGVGSWNFLNFNINSQEYNVAGKKDDFTYKTQFTQSEIDDMPECYTHPAVWEKIKVESENT